VAAARSGLWVVGVGLLALGAGALLVGSSLGVASAGAVGGNKPINASGADKSMIQAHNSPSLVRNPRVPANLAVANRIDSPTFSCALHVSVDGAASWQESKIPFPAGEELPPRCFAPEPAFGADGTMYVSFVTLKGIGNVPNALWTSSSTAGGRTLSVPTRVSGPFAFQARLVADPAKAGHLYLTWLQSQGTAGFGYPNPGNPVVMSKSEDGGATWLPPVTVSGPSRQRAVAPTLALGPKGELHILYLDLVEDALDYHDGHEGRGGEPYPGAWNLVLATSSDRGATWRETVVDDKVVPTERFIVFVAPSPSLAVDPGSGRVYAAFHDGRLGDTDVLVWVSADRGATFAPPTRVNDTSPRDGRSQYLPKVAVAPDGRVDVVYYDRRADPEDRMNEVSLQSSSDGAKSFKPRLRISDRAFDSRIGFGSERNMPELGSRLALLSTTDRALALWTDTRGGSDVTSKQDLAQASVAFTKGSSLRQPLRAGGLPLLAAGVLSLLAAAVTSRRRRRQVSGDLSSKQVVAEPEDSLKIV